MNCYISQIIERIFSKTFMRIMRGFEETLIIKKKNRDSVEGNYICSERRVEESICF